MADKKKSTRKKKPDPPDAQAYERGGVPSEGGPHYKESGAEVVNRVISPSFNLTGDIATLVDPESGHPSLHDAPDAASAKKISYTESPDRDASFYDQYEEEDER